MNAIHPSFLARTAGVLIGLMALVPFSVRAADYSVVKIFAQLDVHVNGVTEGSDGVLYGTTAGDGKSDFGTVFSIHKDGRGLTTLKVFQGGPDDGAYPATSVVEGPDGVLYGTTQGGGTAGKGTVFSIEKDGKKYRVIKNFQGGPLDGESPAAPLVVGRDGRLYGITSVGGSTGHGIVFRLNAHGHEYRVLRSFHGFADGAGPIVLLEGRTDGLLYGATAAGGLDETRGGTVFSMARDGNAFTVLHAFSAANSAAEGLGISSLVQGLDGILFGTTSQAGPTVDVPRGATFELNPDGTGFAVLLQAEPMTNPGHGGMPAPALGERHLITVAGDGDIYGTAVLADPSPIPSVMIYVLSPAGALMTFGFGPNVSGDHVPGLIAGSDGFIYGAFSWDTTYALFKIHPDGFDYDEFGIPPVPGSSLGIIAGGKGLFYGVSPDTGIGNNGEVFSVKKNGRDYAVLKDDFQELGTGDARFPTALLRGSDGALYGIGFGGTGSGAAAVFRINPDGTGYKVIYSLTDPVGVRIFSFFEGSDGAFYGATQNSGINQGVVFRLSLDGTQLSILKTFLGGADGSNPVALTEGKDGKLYGVTFPGVGGFSSPSTLFALNKDGSGYVTLLTFAAGTAGADPDSLIVGADGKLYGTTFDGGANGDGSVFSVDRNGGNYTILKSFAGGPDDGRIPEGPLVEGPGGMLFGTTSFGGMAENGTIYGLHKNGTGYVVLKDYDADQNPKEGSRPHSLLIEKDGVLYGATNGGQQSYAGTIFRLDPGAGGKCR